MKTNKHIYREGDRVRIINPRFVKRVGYPLVWTDLVEEFEDNPNFEQALKLLGIIGPEHKVINSDSRWVREFIRGCAMTAVRARGFGGNERKIFYRDDDLGLSFGAFGDTVSVISKRIVKTGAYYPPSGGTDYYGECTYEPGGLDNCKTHILLSTIYGEIESIDVELVTEEKD